MRISRMILHPIAVADPPLRSSYGLHAPFALRTIVELVSDSGLTGISETYGGDGPLAGLEAVRSRVEGMDPFRLAGLLADLTADAETIGRAAREIAHADYGWDQLVAQLRPVVQA